MSIEMGARALDVDLLARELGNWRTSSRSGPAYLGLADGMRMLIIDGRFPGGARRPRRAAPRGRLPQRPAGRAQPPLTARRAGCLSRRDAPTGQPGPRRAIGTG